MLEKISISTDVSKEELTILRQRVEQLEKALSCADHFVQEQYNLWKDYQKTEQALRESQHKLSFFMQNNPLGVICWNTDFEVTDWNLAAENIFGYSKLEALNCHPTEIIVTESAREQVNQIMMALLQQNGGVCSTNENLTKDGRIITCKWYNKPLTDLDDNVIGIISIVEDITLFQETQLALKRSQARFQKLAANVPGMIYQFHLSPDGTTSFPYVSDACQEIYGVQPEEVKENGALLVEAVHPEDKSCFFESVAVSAQTLQKWDWEGRMFCRSGKLKWIRGISRPELQPDGAILWDGLLVDISERQQAKLALEQANEELEHRVEERTVQLKQSQQLLQLVFDTLPQRVFWKDTNSNYLGCNQLFAQDVGLPSPEEIIGKNDFELFGEESARIYKIDDITTIESNCSKINYEEPQQRQNGTLVWLRKSKIPLRNQDGEIIGVFGSYEDISDRKQAEAALKKQAKELEETLKKLQLTQSQLIQSEKMSSLGQLVAGIAHEINNPVNFIYGNLKHAEKFTQDLLKLLNLYQTYYPDSVLEIEEEAEACELDFLLEDLPKIYSSMKVGATRIREIVAGLRTFSRLDEAELKTADIHEGIDSTLMILEHRLKAKPNCVGIKVIKEYGNLPLVECYAGQLNQVFMNILTNAIDALEEQRISSTQNPEIRIVTEMPTPKQVTILFADNGCGMSEEVQKKLFDPFYTTKAVGKGTGMGLSISYQIITDKHGGSLRCISSPGQGAEFIIEIPYR